MNALQRYERLRAQLTDVADLLDQDGHDALAEAALTAVAVLKEALDEEGIRHYQAWYRRRDAAQEADREIDARETKR